MFRLSVTPCLLCISVAAAAEEPARTCPLTDDQGNCVRILACIGDAGRWFHGRAFGRGEGSLAGETGDGAVCSGTWTERNRIGLGQADVTCDDGLTATVLFYYQDRYTGTALGRGVANGTLPIRSWSGLNVLEYLEATTGKVLTLPCGPVGIPIS